MSPTRPSSTYGRLLWSNWLCLLPTLALALVLGLTAYFNAAVDLGALRLDELERWELRPPGADLGAVTEQLLSRIAFGIASIAMGLVSLVVIAGAAVILVRVLGRLGSSERLRFAAAAVAVILFVGLGRIFELGDDWLVGEPGLSGQLRRATLHGFGLSGAVDADIGIWLFAYLGFAFLLAAASSLLTVAGSDPAAGEPHKTLARHASMLRFLLYGGAAVLTLGVLQMHAFYAWPGAWLDTEQRELVHRIATGLSSANGAFFTLMLLAIYLPTTSVLRARGRWLETELPAGLSDEQRGKWLEEAGLAGAPFKELARVVAAFGPFLAGGPLALFMDLLRF